MDISQLIKPIIQTKHKLFTLKNRKIFLLKCRQNQVIPNFLKFKILHLQYKNHYLSETFQKQFLKFQNKTLNLLISDCIKEETHLLRSCEQQIQTVKRHINEDILTNILETESKKILYKFVKTKNRLIKKLQNLIWEKQQKISHNNHIKNLPTNKWLLNLTDTILPQNVEKILELGPNFAKHYESNKSLPIHDIIASVEQSIEGKSDIEKTDIRIKVCTTIKKFKNIIEKPTIQQKETQIIINETKKFLKEHPNLWILNADKAKQTVIMDKCKYFEKMNVLLEDTNTYKTIAKDLTAIKQKRNNQIVNKWSEELQIDLKTAYNLKLANAQPPRIYGLPKTHKKDVPLRPIVNCIQSPFYNMGKFLSNVLKNIIGKSKNTVKDSWDLADVIRDITIPDNHILISLDVVSLYTNTPTDLAIDILKNRWTEIKEFTKINEKDFIMAVEECLSSSYFKFDNQFYQQIFGVPMGAPLSPFIANLVLEEMEKNILNKLSSDIFLYKRYVDDIFLVIKEGTEQDILKEFNGFHPRLKFSLELETNKCINFLDITIHRKENQLLFKWYTKPV